jgi:hypothetical protein
VLVRVMEAWHACVEGKQARHGRLASARDRRTGTVAMHVGGEKQYWHGRGHECERCGAWS